MKTFRAFCVTFSAGLALLPTLPGAVVINEIHYDPDVKTEPVEFVELHNSGPIAINLNGWRLTDGGNLNYLFPATNVPAGGFVVVAQNPAAAQSKFSVTGVLGPMRPDGTSALSKYGEKITLRDAANAVVDEVEYQLGFPWPTVGGSVTPGQGDSIELIHPSLDNNLAGSWRSSSGTGGTPPANTTLLAASQTWRYRKGTNEASLPVTNAWRQMVFDDSAWSSGLLPIGWGEAFVTNTGTVLGDMNGGYTSVFLRKQFTVSDPAQFSRLVLEAQYDDGFKCWINGTLVIDNTANMPAGEVAYNGTAISALENLNFVSFNLVPNPASVLVNGVNVMAVQAHNNCAALNCSSDFFFDARLIGQAGGSSGSGPSPGRINNRFAINAPPQIRQVEHTPQQPRGAEPVLITARVTDPDGVNAVTLEYQIVSPGNYIEMTDAAFTNAANWISLAMNDAGTGGDVTLADGTYSAEIPASVQVHRRLIRYRITATDFGGRSIRVPYADDPQPNFAYFVYNGVPAWTGAVQPGGAGSNGVVRTIPSNEMARLPVFHLIGRSNTIATATWYSRYGGDAYQWIGTLVYDGKVYDHIHYRARGGVWRYSMVKNMWKFDLNRGHDIEIRDPWGRKFKTAWTKINLGANIQQRDFWARGEQGMFESVGLRIFQMAGVTSPNTSFATLRVIDDALEQDPATQYEGDFWGMYLVVEQENGRFLEERDLPDSNLYKMEGGTGELNNLSPTGPTDKSDLNYILNNYSGKPESWWRTNWNLPKYYSYQAVAQAIHHYDICYDKNFFYYFNSSNRLWEICSWDLDLTWANNMYDAGCGGKDRVYQRVFDETSPAKPNFRIEWNNRMREFRDLFWNSDQAHKLIDEYAALLRGTNAGPNILDADRMMWDYNPKMNSTVYSATLSKAGQGEYYKFSQHTGTNSAALQGGFWATVQIMKNYVGIRGTFLDGLHADAARPVQPAITYTGPAGYPINRISFRSSSYGGVNAFGSMRWRVGEVTDTNSPSYRADEPQVYELEAVWDSGPLSPFNADITVPAQYLRAGGRYRARVQFTDATGRSGNWSAPHEFTVGEPASLADLLAYLRVTEVMFHPPPGGFEFVELYNASSTVTLDLSGVKFTQGIDYTFAQGTMMTPGSYLVIAGTADLEAFRAYYGLDGSVPVVGPFDGGLANSGEQFTLRTAAGGTDIVEFNFSDGRGWPSQADGVGHSLVLLDSALGAQGSGAGEYSGNWRASAYWRGSPGRADALAPAGIVLNEIVSGAHYAPGFLGDWIELYNPTDSPITLGPGWYLSNDGGGYANLMKWQIPPGTMIPARGYVSFDEGTGFHSPTNTGFGLDPTGDKVFLSHLPGTAADRVVDAVSFKAGDENQLTSLSRVPDGGAFWYTLTPLTRDTTNAAPLPSDRAVISEVMYHPPDVLMGTNLVDDALSEFIEIASAGGYVTMTNINSISWRLNGGIQFDFPPNMTLGYPERVLVVNFDPATNAMQLAAFKQLYGITNAAQRILGPYAGKLANNSDRVALESPQTLFAQPGWLVVDEVIYADQSPFPCGSDGSGNSIQRVSELQHGSDPANWAAEPPTAGRERASLPPGLPAVTVPPRDQVVATNGTASFSVSICGTPPFTYQWRFNGTNNLPDATNATLTLVGVQPSQAGQYDVLVSNAAGSVASPAATLIVQFPPAITAHPQPLTVVRDQSAMFSVAAGGTPPFSYQWRLNGFNVPGATNDTLLVSPVRTNDAGNYSALVANTAGAAVSQDALLTVLVPATITQQPTNVALRVPPDLTAAPNRTATFRVTAYASSAIAYQWRLHGTNLPLGHPNYLGVTTSNLVVTNVVYEHGGAYACALTDSIGTVLSSNAVLTPQVGPFFILQPQSQTIYQGDAVTLTVGLTNLSQGPFNFVWRSNSLIIASNHMIAAFTNSITITNVPAISSTLFRYRCDVQSPLQPPQGAPSANALITTITNVDRDLDGLNDPWEQRYGLSTNNAADAYFDGDGDGMINLYEFQADTVPTNALSVLRVTDYLLGASETFNFLAVSNRTYSVQTSGVLPGVPWGSLTNISAAAANRTIRLTNPPPVEPTRFLRLVTPQQP